MGARDPLAFTGMDDSRDGTDRGGTLTVALVDYLEGSGARMVALMDRSGGLLAQAGFGGPGPAADLAALAAGVYAASRRMGEIMGSGSVEEMVALGGAGRLMVCEVPAPRRPLLLLSVFQGPEERPGMDPAVEALAGALADGLGLPGPDAALEASLLDRVDETFGNE